MNYEFSKKEKKEKFFLKSFSQITVLLCVVTSNLMSENITDCIFSININNKNTINNYINSLFKDEKSLCPLISHMSRPFKNIQIPINNNISNQATLASIRDKTKIMKHIAFPEDIYNFGNYLHSVFYIPLTEVPGIDMQYFRSILRSASTIYKNIQALSTNYFELIAKIDENQKIQIVDCSDLLSAISNFLSSMYRIFQKQDLSLNDKLCQYIDQNFKRNLMELQQFYTKLNKEFFNTVENIKKAEDKINKLLSLKNNNLGQEKIEKIDQEIMQLKKILLDNKYATSAANNIHCLKEKVYACYEPYKKKQEYLQYTFIAPFLKGIIQESELAYFRIDWTKSGTKTEINNNRLNYDSAELATIFWNKLGYQNIQSITEKIANNIKVVQYKTEKRYYDIYNRGNNCIFFRIPIKQNLSFTLPKGYNKQCTKKNKENRDPYSKQEQDKEILSINVNSFCNKINDIHNYGPLFIPSLYPEKLEFSSGIPKNGAEIFR